MLSTGAVLLLAIVGLFFSTLILNGQTNSRIDALSTSLNSRIDATNERIDKIFAPDGMAANIKIIQEDLSKLVNGTD